MNNGRQPRFALPFRHPLMALLGLAAIIAGILGMHILNGSHHGTGPGIPTASVTAPADHMPHQHSGGDAAAVSAGSHMEADAAGCAGDCGDGHDMMAAVCILMVIVAGLTSLLVPKRFRLRSRHGRRGPPPLPVPTRPVPRPPSLVQLAISRT